MNKRVIFVVQGEGRGHMTQALAMKSILENNGFEIAAILAGVSKYRRLPDFFIRKSGTTIIRLPSPNFKTDNLGKGIRIYASIMESLLKSPVYFRSIRKLDQVIRKEKPDLILNFMEPLVGLGSLFYKWEAPVVSIGHQFLLFHPDFVFPDGHWAGRSGLKTFIRLTGHGSALRLALSFYKLKDLPEKRIIVSPPLLRNELKELKPHDAGYLLVYLLNKGYSDEIIAWHHDHPETEIHCFTDDPAINDTFLFDDTLTFHALDDRRFLACMADCKALVTTAGFESVCEAMYLGKPVMMIPVKGHFEQFCNSRDAARAGAGIFARHFDLDLLMNYLPEYLPDKTFQQWAAQTPEYILRALNALLQEDETEN